jgi:ribosomal protein S8
MTNIEEKGNEAEAKIYEKFRDNSDICMKRENLEYLEQCYSRYMELCRKKNVSSNLIVRNIETCKREGFFGSFNNELEKEDNEEIQQIRIFSEMKGIKDVRKITVQRWMEMKIKECEGKDHTIPRLGLRHYAMVDKDLGNVFREFEEASIYSNSLCIGCEENELFMETFVDFVTKKLQNHIGQKVGKIIKPNNRKKTLIDENKLRNKARILVRLPNGEEIETDNAQELNSKVIEAEMNALVLRGVIEKYQTLFSSFKTKASIIEEVDMDRVIRFSANVAANLRGALTILEKKEIKSEVIDKIRAEVLKFSDWNEVPKFAYKEEHEEEISCLAEAILEKPYREWLAKEKNKN